MKKKIKGVINVLKYRKKNESKYKGKKSKKQEQIKLPDTDSEFADDEFNKEGITKYLKEKYPDLLFKDEMA